MNINAVRQLMLEADTVNGAHLKIVPLGWRDFLEDQLALAKFALKVAEYELAQAKAALVHVEDEGPSGRLIENRSPVTGRVLNVFEESARVVAADTPIMEVRDPNDLEVEV